jgi:hypothetical protein
MLGLCGHGAASRACIGGRFGRVNGLSGGVILTRLGRRSLMRRPRLVHRSMEPCLHLIELRGDPLVASG